MCISGTVCFGGGGGGGWVGCFGAVCALVFVALITAGFVLLIGWTLKDAGLM
jgi:hypothetical protein